LNLKAGVEGGEPEVSEETIEERDDEDEEGDRIGTAEVPLVRLV
jgi:hypothetical protein